jgi:hypothetical protein
MSNRPGQVARSTKTSWSPQRRWSLPTLVNAIKRQRRTVGFALRKRLELRGSAKPSTASVSCARSELFIAVLFKSRRRLTENWSFATSRYHLAGRRGLTSPLVLQLFLSGSRGNDDCLAASSARRHAV